MMEKNFNSIILERLKVAVMEYNIEQAKILARQAIEKGIAPLKVADALTDAIRKVGDGFGRGELFLPDLIAAAEVMKNVMPIIQEEIKKLNKKLEIADLVVIGTVKGDIHDIGKSMVSMLLAAEGFEVIDLGVDVDSEKFIEAIKNYKPKILAISALLTTTAPEQGKVIEALKKEGLRDKVKVMIGGGAITQKFAEDIGADGYAPTAIEAAKLARKLIGK